MRVHCELCFLLCDALVIDTSYTFSKEGYSNEYAKETWGASLPSSCNHMALVPLGKEHNHVQTNSRPIRWFRAGRTRSARCSKDCSREEHMGRRDESRSSNDEKETR